MKNEVARIDWRKQLAHAESYLDGKGGVVAISASPLAAGINFTEIIRHELEKKNCLTIQIDASNERNRNSNDIIDFLLERLGPATPDADHQTRRHTQDIE